MPPDGCFLFVLSPTGPKPHVQWIGFDDSRESLPTWPVLWFCDATSVAGDVTSASVTGLHHCVTLTWASPHLQHCGFIWDHRCSSAEGWHRIGKAQKAKLSWLCHLSEASPALLMTCGVKGDTRSPPAQGDWSVPCSCRSPSGEKAL